MLIGKEKCNQCNILKNLLDEKGIQYHHVDVSKIPHELLTYLRMYCNIYIYIYPSPLHEKAKRMPIHVYMYIYICIYIYISESTA